ncbi:hypothetical protein DRO64_02695 [Candidatus Bathyarchaeota archaeon]|nr:MAG: hypothetical protein DRO64_02695 [Candidatus Bathyarchaeota archaeon]
MRISVIIVTYNRPILCNRLLQSLEKQSVKPYEAIVIDDHSIKPFHPIKKYCFPLLLIRNKKELGLAASRNIGIKRAKGDILAFIDDDALPFKDWLCSIKKNIIDHELDIVGGPCVAIYMTDPPFWWDPKILGKYLAVANNFIVGCNFAVKKEVFKKIGFFNEKLGRYAGSKISGEETEFILRAYMRGYKVLFTSDVKVRHIISPQRLTLAYLIKRAWSQGLSTYFLTKGNIIYVLKEKEMNRKIRRKNEESPNNAGLRALLTRCIACILLLISLAAFIYASFKY